jgi:hypothetical protein
MEISEAQALLVAKTCGNRRIAYQVLSQPDLHCVDKSDILLAQLAACRKLLKYTADELEKALVRKEISEISLALDLVQ